MKRRISSNNPFARLTGEIPFPVEPKAALWEILNERTRSDYHLDFGAFDGSMLKVMAASGVFERAVGLDANREIVQNSTEKLPRSVSLLGITPHERIPFHPETFSSISLVGVLEHVTDQERLLDDLYRVGQPGALLFVAVPGRHFLSMLDLGNMKFRFPRLHRWWTVRRFGSQYYTTRYVENIHGLIGDIEKDKAWHQHFLASELTNMLLKTGFQPIEIDGIGLFYRFLNIVQHCLPSFARGLIGPLRYLDNRLFERAEIWAAAIKVPKCQTDSSNS